MDIFFHYVLNKIIKQPRVRNHCLMKGSLCCFLAEVQQKYSILSSCLRPIGKEPCSERKEDFGGKSHWGRAYKILFHVTVCLLIWAGYKNTSITLETRSKAYHEGNQSFPKDLPAQDYLYIAPCQHTQWEEQGREVRVKMRLYSIVWGPDSRELHLDWIRFCPLWLNMRSCFGYG